MYLTNKKISKIIKKKNFLIFFLSLFLLILYKKNFEYVSIQLEKIIYETEFKIFMDREYTDTSKSSFLNNTILIRQPRHNSSDIRITFSHPVIIYRGVCLNNNNKQYLDWHNTNYKININGLTCTHSKVIKKKFLKGKFTLFSGGPISSDPIFVKLLNYNTKINILKTSYFKKKY